MVWLCGTLFYNVITAAKQECVHYCVRVIKGKSAVQFSSMGLVNFKSWVLGAVTVIRISLRFNALCVTIRHDFSSRHLVLVKITVFFCGRLHICTLKLSYTVLHFANFNMVYHFYLEFLWLLFVHLPILVSRKREWLIQLITMILF